MLCVRTCSQKVHNSFQHVDLPLKTPVKMGDKEKVTVQFPDLFVSFLAESPRTNTSYASVRQESENAVCW